MDGRGRAFDNILIKRLWRIAEYKDKEIYLKEHASIWECRDALRRYSAFYDHERRHQGLGRGNASGKTVQEKTLLHVVPAQPLLDHGDGHVVGNQLALVGVLHRRLSELGVVFDVVPEHVPGGNMRPFFCFSQSFPLCTFPVPGAPKKINFIVSMTFLSTNFYNNIITVGLSFCPFS